MASIPEDVFQQLKVPFRLGKYIEWAKESTLPGYAGELWKLRRAELSFEIDDVVPCDIADRAVIEQLALHVDGDFPHEGFLKEIKERGHRLVVKLLLKDPDGCSYRGDGGYCSEGQAMLLVSKAEETRYRQALKTYADRTSISSEALTYEDGVRCFLGEYLPREFTVHDACITNLTSAWFCKHFAL